MIFYGLLASGWVMAVIVAILFRSARHEARRQETLARHYQEQADELARQFKEHGTTAISWSRPKKHNKADEFYWLVKIDKEDYLFTHEAMNVGFDRAIKARERKWL